MATRPGSRFPCRRITIGATIELPTNEPEASATGQLHSVTDASGSFVERASGRKLQPQAPPMSIEIGPVELWGWNERSGRRAKEELRTGNLGKVHVPVNLTPGSNDTTQVEEIIP